MVRNPGHHSKYGIFFGALCAPFDDDDYRSYTGFLIAQCIDRKELKLPEDRKPGDIDILAIPYKEDEILYERAAAYEVKVVRPTRSNMKRRPNSFGTKQIIGYIDDGFPFVSAVHIAMTEPLLEQELHQIPLILQGIGDGNPPADAPPLEAYEMMGADWFPYYAEDNHRRRMVSSGIPKYVGLHIESWNEDSNGSLIIPQGRENHGFDGCFWNPKRKRETVDLIATHHQAHPGRYLNVKFDPPPADPDTEEIREGWMTVFPDTDDKGNPTSDNAPAFKLQTLFKPSKIATVLTTSPVAAKFRFPVTGSGMDDGTEKSIRDGDFITVNDLGLPAFDELPSFRPIGIVRLVGGQPAHMIGVITKTHTASQVFRFSFYNQGHPET